METNITLFMALIFVGNATVLWFFAWLLRRLERQISRYHAPSSKTIESIGAGFKQAEAASAVLAGWSSRARKAMVTANDDFDRAEDWFRYGLAKIDFNVERASDELNATAKRISATVAEPLYRTATVIQGIKALFELLTLEQRRDGGRGPRSAA